MSFQLCRSDEVILEEKTNTTLLTYEDIHILYKTDGNFNFKFRIKVVNENAVPISDASEIIFDFRRKFYQIVI